MEKKLSMELISSLSQLYSNTQHFISQNFQELKSLSKTYLSLTKLPPYKITNDLINELTSKQNTLQNNFTVFSDNQTSLITKISSHQQSLVDSLNESSFLLKRPLLMKYIIELPFHINTVKSYMNIIQTNIKNSTYDNIELLYNTLQISVNQIEQVTIK